MALRHIRHLASLLNARSDFTFTLDTLEAHPLTDAYVPQYEELREEWWPVFNEELQIRDKISANDAHILWLGYTLNQIAKRASSILLLLAGGDRSHSLYVAYFKGKTLSDFKKPVLGAKLHAMKAWVKLMKDDTDPDLLALLPELEVALAAAKDALQTRIDLHAESTSFREVGNRRKFFDKLNTIRKDTYNALSKMPLANRSLPLSFADTFFRHFSSGGDEPEETLETIDVDVERLQQQLADKLEMRKVLEGEAKEQVKLAAEKAAKQSEVDELRKHNEESARKLAKASAELEKMQRSRGPRAPSL